MPQERAEKRIDQLPKFTEIADDAMFPFEQGGIAGYGEAQLLKNYNKGEKGDKGDKGDTGETGAKGDKGDSGGQPIPITLASQMADNSKVYLYVGSEEGFEYGRVYAYVNNAWTPTVNYGVPPDAKSAFFFLTDLSTNNGDENKSKIQNALDEYQNVTLEKGEYPLTPTVVIDGGTLDLNGSKVVSTKEKTTDALFLLKGKNPTICNGEISGRYNTADNEEGYSFYEGESLVCVANAEYENARIENIDAHNCWGYAISSRTLTSGDGTGDTWRRKYSGDSAASMQRRTNGIVYDATTNKITIPSGFKYLNAIGGIGYNRIISQEPVTYIFYDETETQLSQTSAPPRRVVEIPDGSATVECVTVLNNDTFLPYYVHFQNYQEGLTVESCVLHNNHSLGMVGMGGETYVFNTRSYENGKPRATATATVRPTTGFCDIEDVATPLAVFRGCESKRERNFLMLGAYRAIVDSCASDENVIVYRGWDVSISNCDLYAAECFDSDVVTRVAVSNCTLKNCGRVGKNYNETNCIYSKWLKDADRRNNFLYVNKNGVETHPLISGVVHGRIYSNTQTGMRYSIATAKGSSLIFENKIAGNENIYGASIVAGDCYGLITDTPHMPNGHTIGDCTFNISTKKSFYLQKDMGTKCSGRYENCAFNLTGAAFVSNTMDYSQDNVPTDLTFYRCVINNADYPFFQNALKSGDKITLIDCIVADINKIDSNGASTLAEIVVINTAENGGSVTVDNALSDTSENPVQNKVIKAALDGKGTYSKPSGGIPKSDLASAVRTSLGKADTALQEHQDISGKQDTLITSGATVGQIAKITAVDANGKPTAWEAADMAGGGNDWTTIIDTTLESDVSRLFYGNLAYKEVELWLEWDSAQSMKFFYALNVPNASASMGSYHNVQDTIARSIGAFYMKAFINPHRKVCSAYEYSLYGGVNQAQVAQLNMLISSNGSGLVPVDRITSDNITSISFANANTDGVVPAGTRVILRGR